MSIPNRGVVPGSQRGNGGHVAILPRLPPTLPSPTAVAVCDIARRIHRARQLLRETKLPIAEVACGDGELSAQRRTYTAEIPTGK